MDITITGSILGDKCTTEIPNLKIGEMRYYLKDNQNIDFSTCKQLLNKALIRIVNKFFEDYIVNIDDTNKIISVKKNNELSLNSSIINKSYICVKEANESCFGTVLYLHDYKVFKYKEKYKLQNGENL